jgi:hypothetical protein
MTVNHRETLTVGVLMGYTDGQLVNEDDCMQDRSRFTETQDGCYSCFNEPSVGAGER